MNIVQKIRSWLGTDYVILVCYDGCNYTKPVMWLGGIPYAAPYLNESKGELRKGGIFKGRLYITEWKPITKRINEYYSS